MKRLKKFDISKCTPPELVPKSPPFELAPLDNIELPWQRERVERYQKEYLEMIEQQNSIPDWDKRLEEILIQLKEEIKRDSN